MAQPKHRPGGSDAPLSATVTVTAETPAELAHLLRGIALLLEEAAARSALPPGRTPSTARIDDARMDPRWTPPGLRTVTRHASAEALSWYGQRGLDFLDHLTPESRRAVLFIAHRAPRVSVDELASEVGKTPGSPLAGALSSIGYAWKRLGAPEPPFERVRSMYEMDPRLARHLLRLVEEPPQDDRR